MERGRCESQTEPAYGSTNWKNDMPLSRTEKVQLLYWCGAATPPYPANSMAKIFLGTIEPAVGLTTGQFAGLSIDRS